MKTYFVDTNIILRFLLNDVPRQAAEAEKYFQKAKDGHLKIIVLPITIFELVFALEKFYGFNKQKTISFVRSVVATSYLDTEDREIFLEALILYAEKNLDFVDIFLFLKAKSRNGEVLSFDKDFGKLMRK